MASGPRPHAARGAGVPPGPGRSLDVEDIIAAALRVGTTRGFEALTMRALAEELGVSAMAAYHHVPNKDALVELVVDAVLADIEIPPADLGDWTARLRELRRRSSVVLGTWPGIDQLVFGRRPTPNGWRIMDGFIQILLDAGLSPKNALLGFIVLHDYGMARSILQRQLREGGAPTRPHTGPQFPALTQIETLWAGIRRPELVAFTDEVIIDGLRALLDRQRAGDELP